MNLNWKLSTLSLSLEGVISRPHFFHGSFLGCLLFFNIPLKTWTTELDTVFYHRSHHYYIVTGPLPHYWAWLHEMPLLSSQ